MDDVTSEDRAFDQTATMPPRRNLRSVSMKRPKQCKRIEIENEELDQIRPRTSSLPSRNFYKLGQFLSPTLSSDYRLRDQDSDIDAGAIYRVRSFEICKGHVINRGDAYKSRSTNSIMSSHSSHSSCIDYRQLTRTPSVNSQGSSDNTRSRASSVANRAYMVALVGSSGVGKTALAQQFMTSEYIGGFDTSLDSETQHIVSVSLDGEESDVSFVEVAVGEEGNGEYDAYIDVFAITDPATFDYAVDLLYKLRKEDFKECPIIFVGHKSDLVRARMISTEEAKSVAITYGCKYIETSNVLNHKVDELLAGVISQIRLKMKENDNTSVSVDDCHLYAGGCYSASPKAIITKLFCKERRISKSCENLYVP